MRFFDEHLKGVQPEVGDPVVSVQDISGRWRAEESWPPEDTRMFDSALRGGTYTDSGSGNGQTPGVTQGIWTISQPLEHDAWLAGTPTVNVSVDSVPNANLAANIYDLAPDGKLLMISRGVQLLRGTGVRNFSIELYGQDFPIPAGHRIAVLISGADTGQFQYPTATRQTVTFRNGSVSLPFLAINRVKFLESLPTPRLISYLGASRTTLPAATITASEQAFSLPPKLIEPDEEEEEGSGNP
jgi:predicted acyl esterase